MFSVIIPLYNKKSFVKRAIDSVLNQSFRQYEIIVVNDGSTDESDKLVDELYFGHVKLINQINSGVSSAGNTGISKAKFDYIAFLDADDFWHPKFLERIFEVISGNKNACLIGSNYSNFSDNYSDVIFSGSTTAKNNSFSLSCRDYFKEALRKNLIWTSAIVLKKSFFDFNKGFDEEIKFGEDIDVWFRAILYYGRLYYVPQILAYYSKEDDKAATRRNYYLKETLIPRILNFDYFPWLNAEEEMGVTEFHKFKIKWVYLRLPPSFTLKENKVEIEKVLEKTEGKFFLMSVIYKFPFLILHYLFRYKFFAKNIRKLILQIDRLGFY